MQQEDVSDIFEDMPHFYAKDAIGLWSILFSPFFGAILMAYNLKAAGKGSWRIPVIMLSIVVAFAIRSLLAVYIPGNFTPLFISNGIGSLILTTVVWNRLLGRDTEYEKRPVWKPVLIGFGICLFLLALGVGAAGYR